MQPTDPSVRSRAGLALVAALVLVAAALLVTLSGTAATAEEVPAAIEGYEYAPADLTVTAGDTITWTNGDAAPHTVTSDDGGPLDSPNMQQGDTWSFTFTQAGGYSYYCAIHPDMVGTVTVTAADTTTTMPGHPTPTTTPENPTPTTAPETPTPTTSPEPVEPAPPGAPDCNESGLVEGVFDPFWVHFQGAHLETSPGQQVAEALAVDDYALVHTILVEKMVDPVVSLLMAAPEALDPFWVHFQGAHLETSPGQQVAEALAVDDYALVHTILVENMVDPLVAEAAGEC